MRIAETGARTISDGTFLLDGGTMFGVIPRVLWAEVHTPDESNRIRLGLNCVLLLASCGPVLVEGGIGRAFSGKDDGIYCVSGDTLGDGLEEAGLEPEDIRYVVLTHLHIDHTGGAVTLDDGGNPSPLFKNASYVVQRREWDDAMDNYGVMRTSYRSPALKAIEESGNLELIDGEFELAPDVKLVPTGGHTRGHQAAVLTAGEEKIIFPGDIIPMAAHIRSTWISSYDLFPMETLKAKKDLLAGAARERALMVFYHDVERPVARILPGEGGRIAIEDVNQRRGGAGDR